MASEEKEEKKEEIHTKHEVPTKGEDMDHTHPANPLHPSHPDNHPHRDHHPHSDYLRKILGIFLGVTILLMFGMGVLTNAPFGSVIVSFGASLLLGLVGLGLLNSDHFDVKFMMLVMIVLLVAFGIFIFQMLPGVEVVSVISINFVLGAVLMWIIAHSHHDDNQVVVEVEGEDQSIEKMVATIEDKCKAFNFVVGRVYSVHHGASAAVRNKIKIDSEWYNEFGKVKEHPEENKNLILGIIEKIRRRLEVSNRIERDVFTEAELGKLKNMERDPAGNAKIIDVLEGNDGDPVEQYHRGALQYCDIALKKLKD